MRATRCTGTAEARLELGPASRQAADSRRRRSPPRCPGRPSGPRSSRPGQPAMAAARAAASALGSRLHAEALCQPAARGKRKDCAVCAGCAPARPAGGIRLPGGEEAHAHHRESVLPAERVEPHRGPRRESRGSGCRLAGTPVRSTAIARVRSRQHPSGAVVSVARSATGAPARGHPSVVPRPPRLPHGAPRSCSRAEGLPWRHAGSRSQPARLRRHRGWTAAVRRRQPPAPRR